MADKVKCNFCDQDFDASEMFYCDDDIRISCDNCIEIAVTNHGRLLNENAKLKEKNEKMKEFFQTIVSLIAEDKREPIYILASVEDLAQQFVLKATSPDEKG